MEPLNASQMKIALKELDLLLDRKLTLIVGGGGAMLLAHSFPLTTFDIDAVPKGLSTIELSALAAKVGRKLNISPDWLNTWYSSFTYVLPTDYEDRLVSVFKGQHLTVLALGAIDLLVMKVFAGRQKDIPHVRALIRAGADTDMVFDRIDELAKKKIPNTTKAARFLETVIDMEEG